MQVLKVHLSQDGARERGQEKKLHFYSNSLFSLIYSVGYPAVDLMNEFLSFIPV